MSIDSLQLSIVEKVKSAVNCNSDIDEYKLYELLTKEIINNHPDKYINEEIKKQAEEKFKQLNELKSEFDIYIEQQRLNRQLAIHTNFNEEKLELVKSSSDKDLEILRLNSEVNKYIREIDNLKAEIEYYKRHLKECQDNYDKRISEELNYSRENIRALYKPKIFGNIVGTASSLASLSLLLPQVKIILNDIGISLILSSVILISISVFWLLSHFRKNIAVKLTDNIISKIFSDDDINRLLNTKTRYNSYGKAYFTEKDVYNIVNCLMSRRWIKLLFVDNISKLRRDIVESILLEFEYKKLILGTRNNGLEKEFIIDGIERVHIGRTYTSNDNNIEPF